MDKLSFLRSTARLPPGFRFNPTDEELVVHYLRRKAFFFPLPASVIAEFDLGKLDPWDLPGGEERERYFFDQRAAAKHGRLNRATSSGYWKSTGRDMAVVSAARRNEVVGMKKVLVFHRGKPGRGSKTDWVMHEYRLSGPEAGGDQGGAMVVPVEDWVICRIFKRRRRSTNSEEFPEGDDAYAQFVDSLRRARPIRRPLIRVASPMPPPMKPTARRRRPAADRFREEEGTFFRCCWLSHHLI